ncbi:ChrR family anti-sigma-E factor [Fluviibacterium sp. DFM31]|uniref:ChrR family anti-sigma-E factor n=1 Tax=Meridianimarinicoccus marinus TaxID=3231483 RepID=A0ABV3L8I8_9RHOB
MVQHHIPDKFLMAYSAGVLPEAFSLAVASHVSLDDDSRARLETFDAVGGAVLDTTPAATISDDCLAATLALIGGKMPDALPPPPRPDSLFPAPLQDYIGGDLDAVKWRGVGMGVKQAILETADEATARLLYIPSGTAVPDHGHNGIELTLVLQGAYRDEGGEFHRGDIEVADESDEHTPIAFGPQPCICLAVTDAKLRFTSLLPRLAQPFLRI